jgi:MFS family permease
MIADVVPPDRLKAAYALSRLAINVGMSVGPAVAGLIATRSFNWIFIVDGATTLAAAAVLIATRFDNVRHAVRGDGSKRAPSLLSSLVLDDRRMVLFLSAIFLTGIVFFQLEGPLPLFLVDELRLSPAFYGGLFTLNTVMIVFMEVPLNSATAHWPHRRALAIGAFLFAVGSGAFAFAGGAMGIIVAMIVWTFGEMMLFPTVTSYIAELAPSGRTGEYMGVLSATFSLALIVGPWAGGAVLDHFGAVPLWAGSFACAALGAAVFFVLANPPVLRGVR